MNNEQVAVLKRTIAKGCSDDEFALFLQVCQRTQLDPFAKQICPVPRWDKKEGRNVMQIQVQIDGLRVLAQRTGQYGGSDRPLFDEGLTLFEHLQTKRGKPQTCAITVYRLVGGQKCAFTAEITWDDFYPGQKNGFMWDSKPYQMISKAVESQALRKAFQLELANLQTPEESPIVIPTRGQLSRSDDWFDAQRQFREATSVEAVQTLAAQVADRIPVGAYAIDREASIARERIAMRTVLAPVQTEKTIPTVTYTTEQQRINFFINRTGTELDKIKEIVTRLQLPESSAQMDASQTQMLIVEMLTEWAIGGQWLDRQVVTGLLSKSIGRSKTDQELWEDFALSIESYELENKESR